MKIWVSLIIGLVLSFSTNVVYDETAVSVKAAAAILINADTGQVLFSKNSDRIMAPASTTKIMTAIIAIEKGNLNHKVTVSRRAASMPPTTMHLRRGDVVSMKELLYGLLLSSGNDAAVAIAEDIAGSEANFAKMMTAKARSLGMMNTVFKNASGLPASGHYTTAHDLALLAGYALKNPTFAAIVQTKVASVSRSSSSSRSLVNHNKLLWQYPYITGIKTGYTRAAGPCLVASAMQNGVSLISVVLKSGNMYQDTIKLFNFGFSNITETETAEPAPTQAPEPTPSATPEPFIPPEIPRYFYYESTHTFPLESSNDPSAIGVQ